MAHGGSPAEAFDVVIPSLPGHGFSGKPETTGWDPIRIARAWARGQLKARGADVSEVFHPGAPGAQFPPDGTGGRLSGPEPNHTSYGSFATFRDPDGNRWLLQEVTKRLPGRIDNAVTAFLSANDLAGALRRAAAAHGQHEAQVRQPDPNWPEWYAEYLAREQSGEALPR